MAQRPSDFNTTTPTGSDSPRQADDELRKIKQYTQNAYNDLTQPSGANVVHTDLYGVNITASDTFFGNLSGDVNGNASSASVLQNARTITLTGDVNTVSNTFNGSSDISFSLSYVDGSVDSDAVGTQAIHTRHLHDGAVSGDKIADNAVTLGEQSVGNYVATINEVSGDSNFVFTNNNTESGEATIALADSITVDVTGDLTGNADTATALETARTIGGVSFDGTSNINLPGVNTTGNQDTTGNAATATALETSRTIGGVSFDGTANINLPGVNAAGNQNTSGNAATATTLETSRNFSISGDVNASSILFDGSGNVNLNASLVANSVGSSEIADGNVTHSKLATNSVDSENIRAGAVNNNHISDVAASKLTGTIDDARLPNSISSDITGNAATATKLETARTISLVTDGTNDGVTGTATFDGSGNVSITTTLVGSVAEGSIETANRWTNARTVTLTGDATGSFSISGDTDVSFATSLASGSVDTAELANDAVTNAKLADDAVDSAQIVDGAVDNVHLAGSIANSKLSNSSITINGTDVALGGSINTANTTYSAGNGITLTGTTFSADPHTGITVDSNGISVTNPFTEADETKLDGIAAGADVTPSWVPASNPNYLSSVAFTNIDAGAVLTSSETFSDVDNQLMTAAAIDDRIESKGYTTNTGTVTGLTAGALIDVGTGATPSVAVDLSELPDGTGSISGTQDEIVYLDNGVQRRKQVSEWSLGQFNNDQGWTSNAGDITAVTAGTLLDGGGTSGSVTLNVDLSEATEITANTTLNASTDHVMVLDAGVAKKVRAGNLNLGSFRNDQGWTSNTGDITAVVAGNGLTGGATSGSATVTVGAGSGITVNADDVAIASNGVTATHLDVSGNGTSGQLLSSDGDGSFSWVEASNPTASSGSFSLSNANTPSVGSGSSLPATAVLEPGASIILDKTGGTAAAVRARTSSAKLMVHISNGSSSTTQFIDGTATFSVSTLGTQVINHSGSDVTLELATAGTLSGNWYKIKY